VLLLSTLSSLVSLSLLILVVLLLLDKVFTVDNCEKEDDNSDEYLLLLKSFTILFFGILLKLPKYEGISMSFSESEFTKVLLLFVSLLSLSSSLSVSLLIFSYEF